MLSNPHLWPILLGLALGFALLAGAWSLLIRRWTTLQRRWVWAATAALASALYLINVDAWLLEPESLVVRRVDVASPDWRGVPLTIAAIADTHVGGPHMDVARMGRIVQRVNALRPELVVLLGDYVAGHAPSGARTENDRKEILGGIATFAALDARYGVVAVLGNHDVWYNTSDVAEALQNAGVAALWNRNIVIRRSDGPLAIVGLADAVTHHENWQDAMDGVPTGADTIVLSHTPDPFTNMPRGPALMLAAHTHCGQVSVPFLGRPFAPVHNKAYACGRVDQGGRTLYVNGGLGTSILPLRFGNPPEITLITIHRVSR